MIRFIRRSWRSSANRKTSHTPPAASAHGFHRPSSSESRTRSAHASGSTRMTALTGETVNVPDAYADARFDRNVDLRTGFRTLNMLVVPVWGSDGRTVVGVIQALNKRNGAFERRDQMLLEQIAETVGPVLEHIPLEG